MSGTYQDQVNNIVPPRAGEIVALAVTNSAAAVDLQSCGDQSPAVDAQAVGIVDSYVVVQNDGTVNVYYAFGPTFASVTGGNAPNPSAATTVNGSTGAVTPVAGTCLFIPPGGSLTVRPTRGSTNTPGGTASKYGTRFFAYVTASGTATVRIGKVSQ